MNTLRHEAHHVLQDCALGELGDNNFVRLFQNNEQFTFFVDNSIGQENANSIAEVYGEMGAGPAIIRREIEAFAVAEVVPAEAIGDKLNEFCRV